MQLAGGLIKGVSSGIVTGAAFLAGHAAVQSVLDSIPAWVHSGLGIANNMMPAIGIALLARLLFSKNVAAFFFLGFLVTAYLNVSVTGMALIGLAVAVIMVTISQKRTAQVSTEGGSKDDDF